MAKPLLIMRQPAKLNTQIENKQTATQIWGHDPVCNSATKPRSSYSKLQPKRANTPFNILFADPVGSVFSVDVNHACVYATASGESEEIKTCQAALV
ncbi:hypothetical protein N9Y42_08190 [Mariniblastus sp.]|nr:hypothetical protein [Mariniblastus sp.]